MRKYVNENPALFAMGADEPEEVEEENRSVRFAATIDYTKIINQIRKWWCHFDGRDPIAFLERVEELREGYGYSHEQLIKGLPEIFRGDVLLWYRNNKDNWGDWEDFETDFRANFLPRKYKTNLKREIMERRQKVGEKFTTYSTVMMTLMRRAGDFNSEQLERIYENMQPKYKLYVRLDDVELLAELQKQAAEFEEIEKERQEVKRKERNKNTSKPVIATIYNKYEHCWQTKRAYKVPVQKTSSKIPLTVRQRRSINKGMPPTTGKRETGRGNNRRYRFEPKIRYLPRPHLEVTIYEKQPGTNRYRIRSITDKSKRHNRSMITNKRKQKSSSAFSRR